MIETDDDKVIGQIILSFGHYALNNVKDNRERPIAAFILGCCLIDQLSCFRYNSEGQFETFVCEYMKVYKSMELCDSIRNKLVHNYSLGGYYKIGFGQKDTTTELPHTMIHVDDFIENLDSAFNEFSTHLLDKKHPARQLAISWNREHRILVHTEYNLPVYSEADANYLKEEYSKKIGRPMTKKQNLKIKDITINQENDGMYSIRVWAMEREDLWLPIEEVAKQCQYQSPQTLLKRRG